MIRRKMLIQLCAASVGARFALGQKRSNKEATKDLSKQPSAPGVQTLLTGLGFGESPRWHKDRLWFSNWGKQEIVAVDDKGKSEVMVRLPFPSFPFSIDWLPNGGLLIVSTSDRPLLRQQPDGSLVTHADLSGLPAQGWNEIVVDGRGNTYINGGELGGKNPASGIVALVAPDGSVRQVADGLAFPNGMAVTPNNSTLIVAESLGKRLTAFNIAPNGSLSNRRVWANLKEGVPDGISTDAEGAIWYADVPNKRCVRVREGGEVLQTVNVDRGCFACMLGGTDRRTLFILAAEWHGFEKMMEGLGTGQVLTVKAPARGVGWP
jgi:sugar lactone lactonase YvrE